MTTKQSQETYTKIYWVFTTFMLLSAMPLGIVLIFVKLFERRRKGKAKKVFHPVADAPLGAQTIHPGTSSPIKESLEEAGKKMRRRTATGLVLSLLSFGLMAFCAMNDINLWMTFWCCCAATTSSCSTWRSPAPPGMKSATPVRSSPCGCTRNVPWRSCWT